MQKDTIFCEDCEALLALSTAPLTPEKEPNPDLDKAHQIADRLFPDFVEKLLKNERFLADRPFKYTHKVMSCYSDDKRSDFFSNTHALLIRCHTKVPLNWNLERKAEREIKKKCKEDQDQEKPALRKPYNRLGDKSNNYDAAKEWLDTYEGLLADSCWELLSRAALCDVVFGKNMVEYKGTADLQRMSLELGGHIRFMAQGHQYHNLVTNVNRRGIPVHDYLAEHIKDLGTLEKLKKLSIPSTVAIKERLSATE